MTQNSFTYSSQSKNIYKLFSSKNMLNFILIVYCFLSCDLICCQPNTFMFYINPAVNSSIIYYFIMLCFCYYTTSLIKIGSFLVGQQLKHAFKILYVNITNLHFIRNLYFILLLQMQKIEKKDLTNTMMLISQGTCNKLL